MKEHQPPAPGQLLILSAPSGAGKSTVIRNLLGRELVPAGSLSFSVSHTTRAARQGEVDGREYHFVDPESFRNLVAADGFLEWAEVFGNYYGTSRQAVMPALAAGVDVLLEIDVQGAEQVKARHADAAAVLLLPPSYEELSRRLYGRGLDDARTIARRLALSTSEIKRYELYDYVIINRDADRAAEALAAIILEKRYRLHRCRAEVEAILRDFPPEEA